MLQLNDRAKSELAAYFEGKEKSALRIYAAAGGSDGPCLAMVLDTPVSDDATFECSGYTFCINKELKKKVGSIHIGYSLVGFLLESTHPLCSGKYAIPDDAAT